MGVKCCSYYVVHCQYHSAPVRVGINLAAGAGERYIARSDERPLANSIYLMRAAPDRGAPL